MEGGDTDRVYGSLSCQRWEIFCNAHIHMVSLDAKRHLHLPFQEVNLCVWDFDRGGGVLNGLTWYCQFYHILLILQLLEEHIYHGFRKQGWRGRGPWSFPVWI